MRAFTQVESTGDARTLPVTALNFSFQPSGRGSFGRTATEGSLSALRPSSVREATVNLSRERKPHGNRVSAKPPRCGQLGPSLERNTDRNSNLSQDDWTNEECEWHTQRPAPVSGLVHRSAHKLAAV